MVPPSTVIAGLIPAKRAWEGFTPFLAFAPEIRKVIYTTNVIESINFQLRKVTKARGSFPTDEAALKLLYLAIRNISDQRGGEAGTGTHGRKNALNALALQFPTDYPSDQHSLQKGYARLTRP